uniref:Purple acid phosphatase N-terminal domain-containing protein n=1 Tax=Oryza glumipatula TaxID=40148 RepID=A0A0D9YP70_9ORYZ
MAAARRRLRVSLQVTVLLVSLLLLPGCLAGRREHAGVNVDKSHGIVINWEKKHPVRRLFLGLATNRHRRILFYRNPGFDPNGEHYSPVSPATP